MANKANLDLTEFQKNIKRELKSINTASKEELLSKANQYLPLNSKFREGLNKRPRGWLKKTLTKVLRGTLKGISKQRMKSSLVDYRDYLDICEAYTREDFPENHYFRREYVDLPLAKANRWVDPRFRLDDKSGKLEKLSFKEIRNLNQAYNRIKELIRVLFQLYTKILVIRLDLYNDERDLDVVNNRLKMWDKWIRGDKGDSYLASYCSREYSDGTGLHVHCFLFFDGQVVSNDQYLARCFGEKWLKMGGSRFHSRNMDKDKLPDGGECLGNVDYWDVYSIEKLIILGKYLIKNLNDREWLEKTGNNKEARLFSCTPIVDYEAKVSDYNDRMVLNVEHNRKKIVDYSWIDRLGLKNEPSVFSRLRDKDRVDYRSVVRKNPKYIRTNRTNPVTITKQKRIRESEINKVLTALFNYEINSSGYDGYYTEKELKRMYKIKHCYLYKKDYRHRQYFNEDGTPKCF